MYIYIYQIDPKLRLALFTLLRLEPDSLGVLAPVCSSMGFLASSVTRRNCMLPLGDTSKMSVSEGNLLACRWLGSLYISRCNFDFIIYIYLFGCDSHGRTTSKTNGYDPNKLEDHYPVLGIGCTWSLLHFGATNRISLQIIPSLAVLLQIHLPCCSSCIHLILFIFQTSFHSDSSPWYPSSSPPSMFRFSV